MSTKEMINSETIKSRLKAGNGFYVKSERVTKKYRFEQNVTGEYVLRFANGGGLTIGRSTEEQFNRLENSVIVQIEILGYYSIKAINLEEVDFCSPTKEKEQKNTDNNIQ